MKTKTAPSCARLTFSAPCTSRSKMQTLAASRTRATAASEVPYTLPCTCACSRNRPGGAGGRPRQRWRCRLHIGAHARARDTGTTPRCGGCARALLNVCKEGVAIGEVIVHARLLARPGGASRVAHAEAKHRREVRLGERRAERSAPGIGPARQANTHHEARDQRSLAHARRAAHHQRRRRARSRHLRAQRVSRRLWRRDERDTEPARACCRLRLPRGCTRLSARCEACASTQARGVTRQCAWALSATSGSHLASRCRSAASRLTAAALPVVAVAARTRDAALGRRKGYRQGDLLGR